MPEGPNITQILTHYLFVTIHHSPQGLAPTTTHTQTPVSAKTHSGTQIRNSGFDLSLSQLLSHLIASHLDPLISSWMLKCSLSLKPKLHVLSSFLPIGRASRGRALHNKNITFSHSPCHFPMVYNDWEKQSLYHTLLRGRLRE